MYVKARALCATWAVIAILSTGCDDSPPAGPDGGGGGGDASSLDASSDAAAVDNGTPVDGPGKQDKGKSDKGQPDKGKPDKGKQDKALPDKALPDSKPSPDMAPPDMALPDKALPDMPQPDTMTPDQLVPDQLQPDLVPHDQGIPPVYITNPSPLSPVVVNKLHQIIFKAKGGLGPGSYKWSGKVPAWAKLNASSGLFSGTPTAPGSYTLNLRVDSGPRWDTRTYKLIVAGALTLSSAAKPYFKATCSATAKINVKSLFSGGHGPFSCKVYTGPGRGAWPGKLNYDASDPTGCTLSGGFDTKDAPGVYGFIVQVSDGLGQTLDVPVSCSNGACPAPMTMSPAIWPPRVVKPGSSYKWIMDLTGVNVICKNASCTSCSVCSDVLLTIQSPFSADNILDCTKTGDICLYNSKLGLYSTCPSTTTWHGEPYVKNHNPLRASGLPGWNSLELKLTYSGNQTSPCGGKQWSCHWDTLEL